MNIAILLYEGLTALDAIGPYEVLSLLPGAKIQFVARETGPKRTDNGFLALSADYSFADAAAPDIVVVPGSSTSTLAPMADRETLDWLRLVHETTEWTTSVCSGALILGAAGLLKGKRATTHWVALKYLKQFGAEAVTERIVEEGKIITAAGVSAGIDMALYLAAKVAGEETAQAIQLMIEYDPQPPFDTGSIDKAPARVRQAAESQLRRAALNAKMIPAAMKVASGRAVEFVKERITPNQN
ncbi:MAG TPA: DJ-1/PfpI family protein [Pyrinomonadaceae bacterium]|jgi:transcriptional regulator GlxA family with amidase domain